MNKNISNYILSLLLSVYFRYVDFAWVEMISNVQNSFVSIVVFWVPVSTCARLLPFEPSISQISDLSNVQHALGHARLVTLSL